VLGIAVKTEAFPTLAGRLNINAVGATPAYICALFNAHTRTFLKLLLNMFAVR